MKRACCVERILICILRELNSGNYVLWFAELAVAVMSDCWTAKHPPNGPATALLRHLTVQTFPVDAIITLATGRKLRRGFTNLRCTQGLLALRR